MGDHQASQLFQLNVSSINLPAFCSMVAIPMKLSSYMTWSASETVASVQLSLKSCYLALQQYSHMIL